MREMIIRIRSEGSFSKRAMKIAKITVLNR